MLSRPCIVLRYNSNIIPNIQTAHIISKDSSSADQARSRHKVPLDSVGSEVVLGSVLADTAEKAV